MKLITRYTDYAIRAVCFMAKQKGRVVSVPELVRATHVPRPFLRKLLQILNKKGILSSHKGKGGGFELKRRAEQIFLLEIMKILQGPVKISECLFKKTPCPNMQTCKLKKRLVNIEKFITSELKDVTMATLSKKEM